MPPRPDPIVERRAQPRPTATERLAARQGRRRHRVRSVIHSATLADNAEHLSTTELKRELDRLADHGNRLHQLME